MSHSAEQYQTTGNRFSAHLGQFDELHRLYIFSDRHNNPSHGPPHLTAESNVSTSLGSQAKTKLV